MTEIENQLWIVSYEDGTTEWYIVDVYDGIYNFTEFDDGKYGSSITVKTLEEAIIEFKAEHKFVNSVTVYSKKLQYTWGEKS